MKEYADEGYKYAVCLDLSKCFDTLNHEQLMNMLREDIKNKRLIDLIKKYLKSGAMENGIVMKTKEGSPQWGNLSPLLANIYLDKFDNGDPYRHRGKLANQPLGKKSSAQNVRICNATNAHVLFLQQKTHQENFISASCLHNADII